MLKNLQKAYELVSEVEGNIVRVMKNGKWGIYDVNNAFVKDTDYDYICEFTNGFAQVKKGNFYGIIDEHGKEIIETKYVHIFDFDRDLAIVYNGRYWGAINTNGRVVIPIMYDKEFHFWGEDYAVVRYFGGYNIINRRGKLMLVQMYTKIEFTDGIYIIDEPWKYVKIKM